MKVFTRMPLHAHAPCSRSRSVLLVTGGAALAIGARYLYDSCSTSTSLRECKDDIEATSACTIVATTTSTAAAAAAVQPPVISIQLVDEMVSIDHDAEPSSEPLAEPSSEPLAEPSSKPLAVEATGVSECMSEADHRSWKAAFDAWQTEKAALRDEVAHATAAAEREKAARKKMKKRQIAESEMHQQLQHDMTAVLQQLETREALVSELRQQLEHAQQRESNMRERLMVLHHQIRVYEMETETQQTSAHAYVNASPNALATEAAAARATMNANAGGEADGRVGPKAPLETVAPQPARGVEQQQQQRQDEAADHAVVPPHAQEPCRPRAASANSSEPETQVEHPLPSAAAAPPAAVAAAAVPRKRRSDPTRPTTTSIARQLEVMKQIEARQRKDDAKSAKEIPLRAELIPAPMPARRGPRWSYP